MQKSIGEWEVKAPLLANQSPEASDGEPATTNKKRVTRRKEENESSMVVNLTLTMSILAGGNWCALKIALRKAALVRGITFLVLSEVQN